MQASLQIPSGYPMDALLQPLASRLAVCLRALSGVQLCPPPVPGSTALPSHLWSIVIVPRSRRGDHCCLTKEQGNI